MKYQPNFFFTLVVSLLLGLTMIGSGLASLSTEKTVSAKTAEAGMVVTSEEPEPVQEEKIEEPKKDSADYMAMPAKPPSLNSKPYILALVDRLKEEAENLRIAEEERKEAEEARIKAEIEAEKDRQLALTVPNKDTYIKAEKDIYGSIYSTANAAGIPKKITADVIKALSYDVDFQRDIKRGNTLTVLYKGTANYKGNIVKADGLHYVKLDLGRREVEIYVVDGKFYYADGSSAKKSLLRTPVDGARITSGFGMRNHPILGYSKMHKGTDFGAGSGTPIFAAGDGKIVEMGKKGAYGNYVRIKHNGTYSTAYAHASRFAKGIKVGSKVKQGQVVAYVGSTGRSTGPHLHYELLKNGKQVNPTAATDLNFANKLAGKELKTFKANKEQLAAKLKRAPSNKAELAAYVIKSSQEKEVASNPTVTR